ncbi:type II CAAX endopeptidase family protein [Nocardioides sp. YIM 152588]|uniref:CPBP family intramembrane glutamic endopeptidase n=1 Tax=Nocardioides sp. YIM 152588 TaxID=3158259 RepID=UPI0032E44E19
MGIRTSPLIQGALEARRRTHWLLAWLVAFAVGVILVYSVVMQIGLALLDTEVEAYAGQWVELVANAATVLVLFLWLRYYERRPFSSVGFRGTAGIARFVAGFLGGIALFAVPVLVLWGTGDLSSSGSEHTELGWSALLLVIAVIPVWLVQGTTEEIVTRGYLLQNNGTQLPGWLAIVLVSVGFGVVHLEFSPIPLAVIILVGLSFAFIAVAQGSIWLVAGLHVGWNFAQGNVFGIPVSGNPRDVSLFAFGPADGAGELMSGGDFGVEGSIVAAALWAAVAVVSFVYFRRAQAARAGTTVPPAEYERADASTAG